MPDYIDRDPIAIKDYAKEVKKYYDDINALMAKSNALIQGCLTDLDDKCSELSTKYNEIAKTVFKQVESYRDLANQLDKKAQALLDVRNEFRF